MHAFCVHCRQWAMIAAIVKKSVYSDEYKVVRETLIAMRRAAGLTQRELAKRLEREYSFVWRIETGERRLDVVEFAWVCNALNRDAAEIYTDMASRWNYGIPSSFRTSAKRVAERSAQKYRTK